MIHREITPRQIVKRGAPTWVVRVPADLRTGTDEPAMRFFGDDKKAAESFARQLREARKTAGHEFLKLTSADQSFILASLQELGVNGLRDAITHYRKQKPTEQVNLPKLRDLCLDSKEKAGVRDNYLKTLKCTLNNFAGSFTKPANDILPADVETWLNSGGWEPKTRLNYLKDVETMFNFGVRRGLLNSNPCDGVERPKIDRKPPTIFKVDEAKRLLETCATHPFLLGRGKKQVFQPDTELLGYICPILFNGLRPDESARTTTANVRWNKGRAVIDLSHGKLTKLRARRLVVLNDASLYWMTLAGPGEYGPKNITIRNKNLKKRMERLIKASGLEWSHDVLRHSFCSYSMQKFGAKETSKLAGHSEDVLYAHYREVVSDSDAEAFFAIRL